MFKQLLTLLRGKSFEAGNAVIQRNAMALLDQQLRDSAAAISAAQHALARAMAEEQQEAQRLAALATRITGLEDRARAAWPATGKTWRCWRRRPSPGWNWTATPPPRRPR